MFITVYTRRMCSLAYRYREWEDMSFLGVVERVLRSNGSSYSRVTKQAVIFGIVRIGKTLMPLC